MYAIAEQPHNAIIILIDIFKFTIEGNYPNTIRDWELYSKAKFRISYMVFLRC